MAEYIKKKEALDRICAEKCGNYGYEECAAPQRCLECQIIEELPATDVVKVVRCRDCVHRLNAGKTVNGNVYFDQCAYSTQIPLKPNGFCDYGKRRKTGER